MTINSILKRLESAKIDKRKHYIMCMDVETASNSRMVYDIGFAICDKKGNIYDKFSFVVKEVYDNKRLMDSAYYKKKLPQYDKDLQEGKILKVEFLEMRKVFMKALSVYGVKTISAYNLPFDTSALQSTTAYLFGHGKKFLDPTFKDINLLCIYSFACEVLYSRPSFLYFVDKYNFYTKGQNPQTSAEIGYRYIKNDPNFVEEHRGLADVEIECQILAKCYAQNKRHESGVIGNPWRIVKKFVESIK